MWDTSVGACEQLLWMTRALQQEGQWLDFRGHFWIARGCEERQEQERRAPGVGEEVCCGRGTVPERVSCTHSVILPTHNGARGASAPLYRCGT